MAYSCQKCSSQSLSRNAFKPVSIPQLQRTKQKQKQTSTVKVTMKGGGDIGRTGEWGRSERLYHRAVLVATGYLIVILVSTVTMLWGSCPEVSVRIDEWRMVVCESAQ